MQKKMFGKLILLSTCPDNSPNALHRTCGTNYKWLILLFTEFETKGFLEEENNDVREMYSSINVLMQPMGKTT